MNMPEGFPDPAEKVDGVALLQEMGLGDLVGQQIEAHDGVYTYDQALTECPPFAQMVTSLAANLEGVPNRNEILTNTVRSIQAPQGESPAFLAQET